MRETSATAPCGAIVVIDDPPARWVPVGAAEAAEAAALRRRTSPGRHASYRRGRAAAHLALGRWSPQPTADVSVVSGPLGQPVVAGAGAGAVSVELSIAHSGTWAAAAAADRGRPVGVDIESRQGWSLATADVSLSPGQRAVAARIGLSTVDDAMIVWTAREAAGKALGTGLLVGAEVLDVGAVERVDEHTVESRFVLLPTMRVVTRVLDDVVVSVATHCRTTAELRVIEDVPGTNGSCMMWVMATAESPPRLPAQLVDVVLAEGG